MFNTIIVQPLLNFLILLYSFVPGRDFGVAVILFTLITRAILWPLSAKPVHSQKAMRALQPEIDKLKKKYKNDPKAMQRAMSELYKEKEVNPLGSCLPTLIQLPILFGFYWVFIKFKDPSFVSLADSSKGILASLYPWVKAVPSVNSIIQAGGSINTKFLGVVDLAKPSIYLGLLAGAVQFIQTKLMSPDKPQDPTQQMMGRMVYLLPALTVIISLRLPAALPLYWTVSTGIAAYQQYLIMHKEIGFLEHIRVKKSKIKNQKSKR